MELSFLEVSLKVIIGFYLLFFTTKLLGKTTIKQLTPFDFISAIVLSELLGNGIYESNVNLFYIFYTIFLWAVLMITMEKVLLKYKGTRNLLEGNPSIIIRDGKIDRHELKKNRMNINQLLSLLRQSEIFSIREVAYAILESNGSISILKKKKYQKVEINDLQLPEPKAFLSTTLIMDGEVVEDNIRDLGFDHYWLENQLTANGYSKSEDVLYADWINNDGIYIVPFTN
ncbi:DUF421 domain-containing protein [Thalassobacillus devorans]|uniref:DUF421 domain-containing protein n=1 Tax=Thalassobacillus devorans TaxID=279813 RepID=A0ABQ1PDX1_9BACI|nr:DUF421 domain-containing protein [Thalassobacillus devorans]NIK29266.1 uncharacterized membrane protein YcaP (DUF421 family) [Thalassobacillus devorans]GGC95346.1 DUF421 domain-containing protein [Thalassobacillus devorans]